MQKVDIQYPPHLDSPEQDEVITKIEEIFDSKIDLDDLKRSTQVSSAKNLNLFQIKPENFDNGQTFKKKFLIFFFSRFIFPLMLSTFVMVLFIIMQIKIKDFCFVPELCTCKNLSIYVYTIFKDVFQHETLIIYWFFLIIYYLTENFFGKRYLKFIFLWMNGVIISIFFTFFYNDRYESVLTSMSLIRQYCLAGFSIFYVIFLLICFQKFSQQILKKIIKIILFTGVLIFHATYLKNTLRATVLVFFQQHFSDIVALNLFKLFLLAYSIFFQYGTNKFLYYFYKDISHNNKNISRNFIMLPMKFIYNDVLSIKLMNLLTMSLTQIYFWICFIDYFFSTISSYLAENLKKRLFILIWRKFFKKTKLFHSNTHNKEISKNFYHLKSGCVLEANLIVLIRIIIFFYFSYFLDFTKAIQLFEDCSLQGEDYGSKFIFKNILFIVFTQICLIIAVFCFMLKRDKVELNSIVEDYSLVMRGFIIVRFFCEIDTCMQFYLHLESLKCGNG